MPSGLSTFYYLSLTVSLVRLNPNRSSADDLKHFRVILITEQPLNCCDTLALQGYFHKVAQHRFANELFLNALTAVYATSFFFILNWHLRARQTIPVFIVDGVPSKQNDLQMHWQFVNLTI